MDEARRRRLVDVVSLLLRHIDEDWDQPHVHEMREAIGEPESNQRQAAIVLRDDLKALHQILLRSRRARVK